MNNIMFERGKKVLLFLSWRDIFAPKKGGAEVYTHEMLKRIDHKKYQVLHISPLFDDSPIYEVHDQIHYMRMGTMITVLLHAFIFYWKYNLDIDFVVDQCNTHRFFTPFWVPKGKRIFFIHQLTREIWFRNAVFPLNYMGYWLETWMLKIYRHNHTMTVSYSTKKDLITLGFNSSLIQIIPEGIEFEPWSEKSFLKKETVPTFIYVGRFAKYKGIDDAFKAYGNFKKTHQEAKLWIVGKENETYKEHVLNKLCELYNLKYGRDPINDDVIYYGFVSNEKKLELMSRAHCVIFPSEREGWGLTVTEAAAVGTPSIVYNSPGLVDAVDYGKAGFLTNQNTVDDLEGIMHKAIHNKKEYMKMRKQAYVYAKQFKWSNTADHFEKMMSRLIQEVA